MFKITYLVVNHSVFTVHLNIGFETLLTRIACFSEKIKHKAHGSLIYKIGCNPLEKVEGQT